MPPKHPLQPGVYYHIYNRGLNKARLFKHDVDFRYFLSLMEAFLCPVSEVLSYALMRNHFHIALRVKTKEETGWLRPEHTNSKDPFVKWSTTLDPPSGRSGIKPEIQLMLRHMLAAYSKWFNARYKRSGKLFEERHERKAVTSDDQLRQLIKYINRNPEHHKVVRNYREYAWTSFHALIDPNASWLAKDAVMNLFQGEQMFISAMDNKDIDDWLIELEA